jgi:hypothetical protein
MIEDIINPTPARKLINKFYYQLPNNGYRNEGLLSCERRYNEAITCAIVCVNEILNINSIDKDYDLSNYWEEVKQELIQIQNDQMEIQTGG